MGQIKYKTSPSLRLPSPYQGEGLRVRFYLIFNYASLLSLVTHPTHYKLTLINPIYQV